MSIAFAEDRGGRPIVRKQVGLALNIHIADALIRTQAEILEVARHPGVVELRGIEPVSGPAGEPRLALVLAPVDGPTIDQVRLDSGQIAGVLAAVATIVADLHDRGVMHGALVAEHVLLAGGTRPKLCGFGTARLTSISGRRAPPSDAPSHHPSTREADVFAIAMLGHDLLARNEQIGLATAKPPGRSDRSKRVRRNAARSLPRTLSDVLTSVPGRRLSARELAAALAQCPGACLPRPNDECPPGLELAPPVTLEDCNLHPAMPDPTSVVASSSEAKAEKVASPAAYSKDQMPKAAVTFDRSMPEFAAVDMCVIGPQASELAAGPVTFVDDPTTARSPSEAESVSAGETDPTKAPPGRRPSTRRFRAATLAAGILSIVALAAGSAALRHRAAAPVRATRSSVIAVPPRLSPRRACRTVEGPAADLNGDGCGEPIAVSGSTLRVGAVRFALGGPDDRAAVGDWDCDGWSTPVLLTGSTGSVYRYDGWPAEGNPEIGVSLGPVPHAVSIQPVRRSMPRHRVTEAVPTSRAAPGRGSQSPSSCDDLLITRDDGSTVVVQARTDSR